MRWRYREKWKPTTGYSLDRSVSVESHVFVDNICMYRQNTQNQKIQEVSLNTQTVIKWNEVSSFFVFEDVFGQQRQGPPIYNIVLQSDIYMFAKLFDTSIGEQPKQQQNDTNSW